MAAVLTKKVTLLFSHFRINSCLFAKLQYIARPIHYSPSYLTFKAELSVRESFMLLGLKEDGASESEVRAAYFKLAKQYHPDSGKTTADADKFASIDNAYRVVLNHLNKKPLEHTDDENLKDKFDIRHTAPQHRQYLEYGGLGTGTPSMREKQYRQHKFEKAIDDVHSHKTTKYGSDETSIAQPEKKAIRKTMVSGAIERMVEDLIQEAMSKGEFKNLPGSGKPIQSDPLKDPYMDSGTHRLNKVLVDSGYVPDWIVLEKEIRDDIWTLRKTIKLQRSKLGPMPFTKKDAIKWDVFQEGFKERVKIIDSKIDKLNLIVPILTRQKVHVNLEKEIMNISKEYSSSPKTDGKNGEDLASVQEKGQPGLEYEEFEEKLKLFFNKYFISIFRSTWCYSNKIFQIFKKIYIK